jgi:hypothetical protein
MADVISPTATDEMSGPNGEASHDQVVPGRARAGTPDEIGIAGAFLMAEGCIHH